MAIQGKKGETSFSMCRHSRVRRNNNVWLEKICFIFWRNAISFSYEFLCSYFSFSFFSTPFHSFLLAHSDTPSLHIHAYTLRHSHTHTHTHTHKHMHCSMGNIVNKEEKCNHFRFSFVTCFNLKCFKCFISFISFFFSYISLSCDPHNFTIT